LNGRKSFFPDLSFPLQITSFTDCGHDISFALWQNCGK
jgi:hypothetical protein